MIESLRALLGADAVTDDPELCRQAGDSWHPVRRKAGAGQVAALARPRDVAALSALVRWANEHGAVLRVRGGGSNIVTQTIPVQTILVDLQAFQTLRWEETSLYVTVGAGWMLAEVEESLRAHGYTLGQFPGSARLTSLGGAVAANAIGCLSGRYARVAERVFALEAVLPQGAIVRTSTAPGAGASFDLMPLLIGTEGTLGIVTEVTLRIQPQPDVRAWACFAFSRRKDAIDALRLVYRCDARPAVARLFDGASSQRLGGDGDLLILGFEGDEVVQTGHFQLAYAVCEQVGGQPVDNEIAERWFDRYGQLATWSLGAREGVIADTLALGVNWTHLEDAEAQVRQALVGQVGQVSIEIAHPEPAGAALEVTFVVQADDDRVAAKEYQRLVGAVTEAALASGGIVAHHFGIGDKMRTAFALERGEAAMAALRTIKQALDPRGVLPPCP